MNQNGMPTKAEREEKAAERERGQRSEKKGQGRQSVARFRVEADGL